MNNKRLLALAGSLALGLATAHAATPEHGPWNLSAGFDYSSGKYGLDTTTDVWSVPLTLGYTGDRWAFRLSVPYIDVSGSSDVIPGIGRVDNRNPVSRGRSAGRGNPGATIVNGTVVTTGSASGLGDVTASARYEFVQSADRSFGMGLTGLAKFGTADADKGLGTGKNDYSVALDIRKAYDSWTTYGSVGWTEYGNSSYIQLKNGFDATLGVGYHASADDTVGAYYLYHEKIAVGGSAQSELTAYWSRQLTDAARLQLYLLGGFADGSPDYGAGASIRYFF